MGSLGDEGQDFITVEYCGDDFLAALAENMQETEDWDDLQAFESEACGALNDMFSKDVYSIDDQDNQENIKDNVYIIEDSPELKKSRTFMEVNSSPDGGGTDFTIPAKRVPGSNPSQILTRHSSGSVVCSEIVF